MLNSRLLLLSCTPPQVNLLPVHDGMREPHRALEAVSYATIAVVLSNAAVGVLLAWLYSGGGRSVEQIILLNLPPHSLPTYLVEASTTVVTLLGYPLLMLPVMTLLPARLPPNLQKHSDGLRLGFLACTTSLALLLREFALVASLVGCLSIFVCTVLPPLCHLRLCTWPAAKDRLLDTTDGGARGGGCAKKRRPALAVLDAAIFVGGACAFVYFTAAALHPS